ncbi:polyprenyl synthetase superfamily protein [Besnoitia besnoiti]|uniref:Polyprenyl synthetase superfamily protein n=1 Tax=Besnoitia besnoiti TaxID=94643 RepID=A0A2A9MH89_BESBE|nr:polyprenyl synthetase superfamily protein [Besnoitia besnoiti]PFH35326.1 polyprenyl synthetase superfamily protein [Besnoitia besnoiti]
MALTSPSLWSRGRKGGRFLRLSARRHYVPSNSSSLRKGPSFVRASSPSLFPGLSTRLALRTSGSSFSSPCCSPASVSCSSLRVSSIPRSFPSCGTLQAPESLCLYHPSSSFGPQCPRWAPPGPVRSGRSHWGARFSRAFSTCLESRRQVGDHAPPQLQSQIGAASVSRKGDAPAHAASDPLAVAWQASARDAEKHFKEAFSDVRATFLRQIEGLGLPASLSASVVAYYARLLDYTCTGGKLTRGMLVLYAAAASKADTPVATRGSPSSSPHPEAPGSAAAPASVSALSPSSLRSLAALGWCVELLQSCFLVMDDVMDRSLTRRGKTCWYRCEGIGVSNALNDSLVLEAAVYRTLREYLRDHPSFLAFQDLLLVNTFTTLIGQHLDSEDALGSLGLNSSRDRPAFVEPASPQEAYPEEAGADPSLNLSGQACGGGANASAAGATTPPVAPSSRPPLESPKGATLADALADRQVAVARLKTSHYSFYLPTALGMTFAGLDDPALMTHAKDICLAIGEYFQVQDDYLDCFSDPSVSGKVGSDIQEKKCSWLFIQAVRRASPEDLATLLEVYGSAEHVAWVKSLYARLGLPAVYSQYEEETLAKLKKAVAAFPHDGLRAFFGLVLQRLHGRQK